jgi:hypothetical protein
MAKDSVLTLRVETDLLDRLRELARRADVGVSDLVRAAAKRLIAPSDGLEELAEQQQPYTFRCEHMSISGAGLRSARCSWCAKP